MQNKRNKNCWYLDMGFMHYEEALLVQEKCVKYRSKNQTPDILILLEHYSVLTLGMNGKEENIIAYDQLKEKGIKFVRTTRGGDVTYHGPGQLVCYPIIDLKNHYQDGHWFINILEEIVIQLLSEYAINAERKKGFPGVWVGEKKIAAIGISVNDQWITMHGIALNVTTNLEFFKMINPCGITDKSVTSISKILKQDIAMSEIKEKFVYYFTNLFNVSMTKHLNDFHLFK